MASPWAGKGKAASEEPRMPEAREPHPPNFTRVYGG